MEEKKKQYLGDTREELTGLFMRLVQRLDRVHTTAIVYVRSFRTKYKKVTQVKNEDPTAF